MAERRADRYPEPGQQPDRSGPAQGSRIPEPNPGNGHRQAQRGAEGRPQIGRHRREGGMAAAPGAAESDRQGDPCHPGKERPENTTPRLFAHAPS
jgi:hypothetical protein